MINIQTALLSNYSSILTKKYVPVSVHNNYKKWLRFYLDFCHKYGQPYASRDSLKRYIDKLHEKNQSPEHQKEVANAVSLYYEMLQAGAESKPGDSSDSTATTPHFVLPSLTKEGNQRGGCKSGTALLSASTESKTDGSSDVAFAEWQKAHIDLFAEIKVKHYSPKTLRSYSIWVKQFQSFTKSKKIDIFY